MQKFAYTLVASLGAATSAHAEVPVYRDHVVTLHETLVIDDAGPRYYRNVRMAANPDGSFSVVSAEKRQLVRVNALSFVMPAALTWELGVEVRGNMTQSCLALEEPLVTRKDREFTIAVAETPFDPNIQCFSGATDFVLTVPLDIQGLPAGEYRVLVNGVEKRFTLGDNGLPVPQPNTTP